MSEKTPKKTRMKIITDDVKLRHTSHWDEDYLSREELDALYGTKDTEAGKDDDKKKKPTDDSSKKD